MSATTIARNLRGAGAAVWIGGQLFAVVALPRAASAIPRWRDRRRVMVAGWEAWSPISLASMSLATAGSIFELVSATPGHRTRARLRTGSALLGLASTATACVLGYLAKRQRAKEGTGMARDASGYPIALTRSTSAFEKGMIPLNVLHALGAAGLVLADA